MRSTSVVVMVNRPLPEFQPLVDAPYFNFTKSRTKIAHTPTVIGNWANCASRSAPPRGTRNVSANIAKAVSTPRTNLVLEFIVLSPLFILYHPAPEDLARKSSSQNGPSATCPSRTCPISQQPWKKRATMGRRLSNVTTAHTPSSWKISASA